ncbi:DUF397 domain-containing protein [Streptomyces sp. NPDC002537]
MITHSLPHHRWCKSSYSGDEGPQCVEVQPTCDDLIAIGDSKNHPRDILAIPARTWTAFIHAVHHDLLVKG